MNRVKDGSRDSGRDPQGLDAKHDSLTAKPERPDLVSKLTSLMPKVTEGPWDLRNEGGVAGGISYRAITARNRIVAQAAWMGNGSDEANAELIALAPEIATALLAQSALLEEAVSALEAGKLSVTGIAVRVHFDDRKDAERLFELLATLRGRQTLTRISEAQSHANQ